MLIVDLSNNQGNLVPIVEAAHHAGVKGVIFKISQGRNFVDGRARAGIHRARQLGMKVGGYHFGDQSDPHAEAIHFVDSAHRAGLWRKGDIRPVLDFETGGHGHASPWREAFASSVSAHAHGAHIILYSYPGFNNLWLRSHIELNNRVWVANYSPNFKGLPGYKKGDHWLWQFTDRQALGLTEAERNARKMKIWHPVTGAPFHVDCSRVLGRIPSLTLRANCLARDC